MKSGVGDEKNDLVLAKIIERIFPEKEDSVPNVQLAFVIAVCVTILNPKHASIRLNKVALKDKVEYYLVSFCKFVNCDIVTRAPNGSGQFGLTRNIQVGSSNS